jgi:hypothetical protein
VFGKRNSTKIITTAHAYLKLQQILGNQMDFEMVKKLRLPVDGTNVQN